MAWLKPLPTILPENEPFFSGLREQKFRVPRCKSCGDYNWTPYPACRACLSTDQEWVEVSGEGTLYTYTVVHSGPKTFTEEGPYVWAFMQLKEAPRNLIVMGNLFGVPHDRIAIGMPLKIGYHEAPGYDVTLYHFEAA